MKQAVDNQRVKNTPLPILTTFGGFEIATMTAAMLTAAEKGMTILVDGFIATSAFLAAHALDKTVKDYALFCHLSDEAGHQRMLNFLEVKPLLRMGLRLGEGTGAALAYPIVQAAVLFMNELEQQPHKKALIVAHGGVIRAIIANAIGLPLERAFQIDLSYGSVIHLKLYADKSWNRMFL